MANASALVHLDQMTTLDAPGGIIGRWWHRLAPVPGGKTMFTIRWAAHNAAPDEQKVFDSAHDSMAQGWSGTMKQLEAYLAKAKQGAQA